MKLPFAYYLNNSGEIQINQSQAAVVIHIYDLYLSGKSLSGIVECLRREGILSPAGKDTWTVQSVDNLLANKKYIPIVGVDTYYQTQFEKAQRLSTIEKGQRKTTRYNSMNVLSGLLVCGKCGSNYRRITRKPGEVVWRCADKVENGKNARCQNVNTISDKEIKEIICQRLGIATFYEETVKSNVDVIEISDKQISICLNHQNTSEMHM